ncbi:carbonic anhydrase [Paenibacillus algorifonticola]|uniref:carbonic anhydrase n=1 Tax=Paenibacillus algorifonticola TaxID=684063 RepID=A0A1I2IZC3_9BACL|nr:carbonic anhydrase [Paenibacillus algorifonticola]SFF47795.1 carbonic anhydrase [Paenibacillus algorifonticola]
MSIVNDLLSYNEKFVEEKRYEQFLTDKFPAKKLAILTCMDTRLVELLPQALNLRNGDAKIIKNAGAILTQPFGSAMRSILVAVYELGVEEVLVIGHHGCGMNNLDTQGMVNKFKENGISEVVIETLESSGIKMDRFLKGFDKVEEGVMDSIGIIRNHPLMPAHIPVHGFIIDPETGRIELVDEGYKKE